MTRILFIGGYGRSGTTLVERVLGQIDGFCAVGEVRHIWVRSFRENQLCGCGVPFHDCGFWREVGKRAFGGLARIDVARAIALQQGIDRTRFAAHTVLPGRGEFRDRLEEYTSLLARLYDAIREVSGCRVIIDSSKEPSHGFILRRVPGVEPSMLHLVRDSRAVAFSWVRRKERPEVHWAREFMDVHSPLKSAALWTAFNALCRALGTLGVPYRRAHYEDFVADPGALVRGILADLGEAGAPLGFLRGRSVTLAPNHTVSGNPMRFKVGSIELALDGEWREKMSRRDRRLMTGLTLPLLALYGYLGTRRGARIALPELARDSG
jgi:hypothetical protein